MSAHYLEHPPSQALHRHGSFLNEMLRVVELVKPHPL